MELTKERIEYLINRFEIIVSVRGSMKVDLTEDRFNLCDFEYFDTYGRYTYIYDNETEDSDDYEVDSGDNYEILELLNEIAIKNDKNQEDK